MALQAMSSNHHYHPKAKHLCTGCRAPCSASAPTCSLRCEWSLSNCCVQCGRDLPSVNSSSNNFSNNGKIVFCSALCADEGRRGNWCVCGVRQLKQGQSRCSTDCTAIYAVPGPIANAAAAAASAASATSAGSNHGSSGSNSNGSAAPSITASSSASISSNEASSAAAAAAVLGMTVPMESPFPSRRTSPNEGKARPSLRGASLVPVGDKIHERIVRPFERYGMAVHHVVQLSAAPADRKAYNAHRLAVDQRMSQARQSKWGFGGEGNEGKRFVPLLAPTCGMHVNGLQYAADGSTPLVCDQADCDVCRIISQGMKLSAMCGRNSHFSVPNLESALPWCADAAAPAVHPAAAAAANCSQMLHAVALVRVVLGNVFLVNDLAQVQPPPIGYDTTILLDEKSMQAATDAAFTYSDHAIQPEYIVFFSPSLAHNNNNNNNASSSAAAAAMATMDHQQRQTPALHQSQLHMLQQQQMQQQQMQQPSSSYQHHQQEQLLQQQQYYQQQYSNYYYANNNNVAAAASSSGPMMMPPAAYEHQGFPVVEEPEATM